ncbi:flagellar basal body rod protein FlgB [Pectinatus haikarae]|uniref:Flagellar basal body rod protein FlgB n=1 Tax=Pectinatus haikarae TaxID=349096 RepID=A0ABT9Y9C7_9FIRM|nr:flagellar basal body rod protein FlgB [Pectinatus haikarae]MDQ0203787.1 flagellar basal-body rod protein FlgB [Pectinatus haikarae]
MLGNVVNTPVFGVLEMAMQAANMRQQVISNNIANVNTPNFKRNELAFESLLAKALYPEDDDETLQLAKTNEKHFPNDNTGEESVQPVLRTDNSTTMRADGNNVDPDIEMSALAKNTLYYNALVREMNVNITKLSNVIKGQ